MSWFSILPASISFIEVWIVRSFIFLGAIVIAPWLLLIVYDAILYVLRLATYELPVVGGRARNRPRPRAPSLSERPSGRPWTFSMLGSEDNGSGIEKLRAVDALDGLKQRLHSRTASGNMTVLER